MSKLRASDLESYDVDSVLEMDADDIADSGFVIPLAASYSFNILSSKLETFEGKDGKPDTSAIVVTLQPTGIIELIEGPDGETAEELSALPPETLQGMVPEELKFSYFMPRNAPNFQTTFKPVAKQLSGKEKITVREIMEALPGADIEGTITYYRKTDDDGNKKVYTNLNDVVLAAAAG